MRRAVRTRSIVAAAAASSCFLLSSGHASASFIIGAASGYAFISSPNATGVQLSNSTYNGNAGVANPNTTAGGNYVQFSSGTINGNFDFAGTAQTNLGSGTLTGTKNGNVSAVTSAYSTIANLATTFAAEPGTSFPSGTQTLTAGSGSLDVSGNFVFTTTANNFLQGGVLTISGSASQYVVINVTGQNNVALKNALLLTGGITDDHVFINITGTGQQVGGNTNGGQNGGAINGIIAAPNDTFNIDNTVFDGRIFGGDSGNFMLVSGITLNAPVPEPASAGLVGAAVLLGSLRRRPRRPDKPATDAVGLQPVIAT
jgi:hypothetical protein